MAGFRCSHLAWAFCLVVLCRVPGRSAEQNPAAEMQLLRAIAQGDLAEVERIAGGLDLSKVTNLYMHVLNSPSPEVVDFLREQEDLDISNLQMLAIRGDAKGIKRFAESTDKKTRARELRKGLMAPFYSYTPLMLGISHGHTDAVRALIDAGADVNEESRYSLTPLGRAAERGQVEVVKDLLKAGAKIDAAPDGYTALMRASWGVQPKAVEFLLNAKADPNLKRQDGQTALHFAAKKGSAECIKLLLKSGADVNALAYQTKSALYYAEVYEHKAAIEVLRQALAKPGKN